MKKKVEPHPVLPDSLKDNQKTKTEKPKEVKNPHPKPPHYYY